MADSSKPKAKNSLAAMFEQSVSEVNVSTAPPVKKVVKKLVNPFEQNIQAQAASASAPVPKPAPVATKKVVAPKPAPAQAQSLAANFERQQSKIQEETIPNKAVKQSSAADALDRQQSTVQEEAPPKKPGKLLTNVFEQNILQSQSQVQMKPKPLVAKKPVVTAPPAQPVPKPSPIVPTKPVTAVPVPTPAQPNAPVAAKPSTTASAEAKSSTEQAKQAANLRKKLTFVAKERTPSPSERQKPNVIGAKKQIDPAALFGQDSSEVDNTVKPATSKKLKIPVFDVDEEEEKKAPVVRKPIAKIAKNEGEDDFKANLAAMLARGPSHVARAPAARHGHTMMSNTEDIVEARLDMPKVTRSRGVTTKYNLDKFDFDDF